MPGQAQTGADRVLNRVSDASQRDVPFHCHMDLFYPFYPINTRAFTEAQKQNIYKGLHPVPSEK